MESIKGQVMVRGIRGAITVKQNSREDILNATGELLTAMVEANSIREEDVTAVFFSVTADLDGAFPAEAARMHGWHYAPLFCSVEIDVPDSLRRCIRVLILFNTSMTQREIRPVYLKGARILRKDFIEECIEECIEESIEECVEVNYSEDTCAGDSIVSSPAGDNDDNAGNAGNFGTNANYVGNNADNKIRDNSNR